MLQETLAGALLAAQQEQAELSSQLVRVSQDRDKLAKAVSTAHIRYNKQLEGLRERLRAYEDPERQDSSFTDTNSDIDNSVAELARLEAETMRLRTELKASVLKAQQADAKCQAMAAAHRPGRRGATRGG